MIDIDHELDKLQREFHALPQQVEAAQAIALRKTGRWLAVQIKKKTAKSMRVPLRSISDRFYVTRVPKYGDRVTVWIGRWNVDPYAVGKPTQVGSRTYGGKKARSLMAGVKVGRRFYRGAFIASIYSGREKIWIRQKSKYYSSALYPTRHRAGDRGALSDPRLKYRFPVVRAAIDMTEAVDKYAEMYEAEIDAEYLKKFRQELNYQTRVKGITRP